MHAHDYRDDGPRLTIFREPLTEPGHLFRIEGIVRGVVERDEVDGAVHDPMIVSAETAGVMVGIALGAEARAVQIGLKLHAVGGAGLRENHLVIADAQKDLQGVEGPQLVVDEVRPGIFQVGNDIEVGIL